jgi:hypothetical protein
MNTYGHGRTVKPNESISQLIDNLARLYMDQLAAVTTLEEAMPIMETANKVLDVTLTADIKRALSTLRYNLAMVVQSADLFEFSGLNSKVPGVTYTPMRIFLPAEQLGAFYSNDAMKRLGIVLSRIDDIEHRDIAFRFVVRTAGESSNARRGRERGRGRGRGGRSDRREPRVRGPRDQVGGLDDDAVQKILDRVAEVNADDGEVTIMTEVTTGKWADQVGE